MRALTEWPLLAPQATRDSQEEWRDHIVKEALQIILTAEEEPYLLRDTKAEASVGVDVVCILSLDASADFKDPRLRRGRNVSKLDLDKKTFEGHLFPRELQYSLNDSADAV